MKLKVNTEYVPQTAYNEIHKLLLLAKLSHYTTKSFAQHEALGKTYDALSDLVDTITEKLIGYSEIDPTNLTIGVILTLQPEDLAKQIIDSAADLETYASSKKYCDIENLAQELSGVGAQLKYLSRFS